MSKGHQRHAARHHGLSLFGKDLVRRCSSHCELCDVQGVKLSIFEVPPIAETPEFERCVMLCDNCIDQIEKPKLRDSNYLRCLNHSVWSTVPAVKALAVKLVEALSEQERWALELKEQLYIEPELQHWLDTMELP